MSSSAAVPRNQRTTWAWAFGTFFGIGLVGKGGGTVASVAVLGLWWALASFASPNLTLIITVAAATFATIIGIPSSRVVAMESGKKDPSEVVIDEVAGQLFPLIICPFHWKYALASLILFRGLDILKPPPIGTLEKLDGGWGIMMDDVAAGLIAMLIVGAMRHFQVFAF